MNNRQKQWQLYFLDYYGEDLTDIDGIIGPKSEAATLQFQKEFFPDAIAHESIFGDNTAAKSMEIIDRIQDILQSVVPELVDDGLAGPKTMEALQIWQEAKGLPATGRVDDDTWDALMLEVPKVEHSSEPVPELDTGATDNNVGGTTGTFWDEIEYFTRDEFRCKCGGKYCNGFPAEPKEQMVRIADQLRKNLGVPIRVVSGLRCPTWNRLQGGVETSQHQYGEACDIYAAGCSQAQVEAELDRIGGVRYHYPITGSANVHFDIPKGQR